MTENMGTRDDLPPGGGVDELKIKPPVEINIADLDLDYTGEGGDGQTEPVSEPS